MRRVSSLLVCVTLFSVASLSAQWPQRRYKVGDSQVWAQPVVLKDSIIVRTADAVTRWKF